MSSLLILIAVVPGLVLAVMVYKLDKIEKESPKTLFKLFALGALSIIPALLLELAGDKIIQYLFPQNTTVYLLVENIVGVACVEEAGKYLALRTTWKKPEFNYRFDAVVYSVMVTLGFAIFENISYAFSYGLSTTISRAFTAIPAHTIFGIFMGHYYGQAKYWLYHSNRKKSKWNLRLAYFVPVLLHGFYDYFASCGDDTSTYLFIILVIAMDIIAIVKIRKYSREDTPIAAWDSSVPVVGWFPEDGQKQVPPTVNPYSYGAAPGTVYTTSQQAPATGQYVNPQGQGQYANPTAQQPQYYNPQAQGQYANPTAQQPQYYNPQAQGQYANPAAQQPQYYNPQAQGQYANPTVQQPQYYNPQAQGQYVNPAVQQPQYYNPQAQGQYANPTVQQPQYYNPQAQGQYANPTAQQPQYNQQGQYVNPNAGQPQYNAAYRNSTPGNYVKTAPAPNHSYTPSRAYLHAEANLENVSDEGYSLNSFVEKDPSEDKN